jgi:hypothetical protein
MEYQIHVTSQKVWLRANFIKVISGKSKNPETL